MNAPLVTNHPPPLRRKHRWFQFSLRALLVLVMLCALACSWLAVKIQEAKLEEAAAAEIENARGSVEWEESSAPTWLRGALGEHCFLHVKGAVMWDGDVNDKLLEQLRAFNHLQTLYIAGSEVSDVGLEHLQELRELKELTLSRTRVTDAGLEKLVSLRHLAVLVVDRTKVTDSGLEHLKQMTELREVSLSGTRVTADGVKKLQQALPNCRITSDVSFSIAL